jgi:hypothetical protein
MIIIILLILFLIFLKKENFNNPKKIISKKDNIENYLKELNCNNFLFLDNHEVFDYNFKEIKIVLQPIIDKLNFDLSTNFIIFEILNHKKYLGGYYHIQFSAVNDHFVNNFEIKFKYENKRIVIGSFILLNSKNNNIKGFDNQKLEEKNKIGLQDDYSWMFDLSKGDMGLIPHTGNNQN